MTKKVLKNQQKEAREIVKQIFNLALAVNPNDTKQDTTGNKPIAWDDEYEPYPEEKECEELSKAKAALAELKRIADKWGVDYV